MVLKIAGAVLDAILPSKYYIHAVVALVVLYALRTVAQGRKTTRERDMHARVVLVTGAFTPLGVTLLQALAERGTHIIALSPDPIDTPQVDLIIDVLRTSTSNEQIFAEHCDLTSPASVHAFCKRFLTGQETRLDAIIFAHEYKHVGCVLSPQPHAQANADARHAGAMATFLITTLLLPALLVAPVERDIRIINVVNPFYAAAVPSFTGPAPSPTAPTSLLEGRRSLRTAVLTRHLQRVLDALPNRAQPPQTDEGKNAVPVVSQKVQRSNIVAVSVSPGFSRTDIVAPLLGADRLSAQRSFVGSLLYFLLQPFLRLLAKSSTSSIQTILHVLFLPTPFKTAPKRAAGRQAKASASDTDSPIVADNDDDVLPEEVLKPGALYAECAVVPVQISAPALPRKSEKAAGKAKAVDEDGQLPDDGEMGGEEVGRLVWESFEEGLKAWDDGEGAGAEKAGTDATS